MMQDWHLLNEPVRFEIRALREGAAPQSAIFKPEWLDDAVSFIADLNSKRFNTYAVRNPLRDSVVGSGTDEDVVAACFLWADFDEPGTAEKVLKWSGPKYSAAIVTGNIPGARVHTYWRLAEPCRDLALWRDTQAAIAAHLGSDSTVINASRIMRIGGTITWPFENKRKRGYVSELTTIRTVYSDERAPVTIDQMRRAFGHTEPFVKPLAIDTALGDVRPPLDRERARIQAMSGQEWHNAVIRLVASYVSRGLSDDEIHGLTAPLTLSGYTVEQTRAEVQTAIDGARRKGWTPEPQDAAHRFDHTASTGEDQSAGWKVQGVADFTADFVAPEYIIDGVIRRGMVYTLTAPTGSGKTAVMLYAATAIATGQTFCEHEVEQGDVLFMAGENPDDVRARVIATMEFYGIDVAKCRLHFIAGTFSIRADMERLRAEAEKLPNLVLVVIDTFAAYFDGDDENSNAQALDFARLTRKIAAFESKPAIVMPAHPVKNATRQNLTPKGGSSLLNEVDGNLTLWNDGGILSLHWQGKFRGAEFEALQFELEKYQCNRLRDSKGRQMPTILAKPLMQSRALQIAQDNLTSENRTLLSIEDHPELSVAERCIQIKLMLNNGEPAKSKLHRIIAKLESKKLIKRFHTGWELTGDGERAVKLIKQGRKFAPETGA